MAYAFSPLLSWKVDFKRAIIKLNPHAYLRTRHHCFQIAAADRVAVNGHIYAQTLPHCRQFNKKIRDILIQTWTVFRFLIELQDFGNGYLSKSKHNVKGCKLLPVRIPARAGRKDARCNWMPGESPPIHFAALAQARIALSLAVPRVMLHPRRERNSLSQRHLLWRTV